MASEIDSEFNLLLIGRRRSGQSSMGKSILGRHVMKLLCQTQPGTQGTEKHMKFCNRTFFNVVDVPDVVDNLLNEEERMERLNTKMKEVMLLTPGGIDAFLYVPKYGNRITDEDLTFFIFLKVLFGQDFAKDRCILILTGQGESEQFHSLKEECGNRVLLFDNMNEDIQRNQLENLVSQVAELRRNNFYKRYKDENFEKAKALRSEESKKEEKILTKVYGLLQTLKEPNGTYSQDKLLNLSSECGQVLLSIEEQDKDTGSLNEMKEKLKSLKTSLDKCWCLYSLNPDNIRKGRERKKI